MLDSESENTESAEQNNSVTDVVNTVDQSLAEAEAAATSVMDDRATPAAETVDSSAALAPDVASEPVPPVAYADVPVAVPHDSTGVSVPPLGEPAGTPYEQQHPVFVQALEPPQRRGNRLLAGAIGLVAAFAFAVVLYGVILAVHVFDGGVTFNRDFYLAPLSTWELWIPTVTFFFSFWLLGVCVNRGRWAFWVLFGVFVAGLTWLGSIFGQLVDMSLYSMTPSQFLHQARDHMLSFAAVASFVIAREVCVWFGSWVSWSGRRVTEENERAQKEYEETLEAGPQPVTDVLGEPTAPQYR